MATYKTKLADLDQQINKARVRRDSLLDLGHFIEYDAVEDLIDSLLELRFKFTEQHPELVTA